MSLETPRYGSLNQFFKSIDSVLLSFLWHRETPHLKLAILQQPWGEGGLAVPNFFKYFLAGQLTVAHRWLTAPWDNASIFLEAAFVGSYEALSHLVYRGLKSPYPLTSSMQSVIKAWSVAQGFKAN